MIQLLKDCFGTGRVVVLAGRPGSFKSTLLTQLTEKFRKFYYVSAEESEEDLKRRFARLSISQVDSSSVSHDLSDLLPRFKEKSIDLLVVDSFNTACRSRKSLRDLKTYARGKNVLVVGSYCVSRDGKIPSSIETVADAIWFLERVDGNEYVLRVKKDRDNSFPFRAMQFEVTDRGLVSGEFQIIW